MHRGKVAAMPLKKASDHFRQACRPRAFRLFRAWISRRLQSFLSALAGAAPLSCRNTTRKFPPPPPSSHLTPHTSLLSLLRLLGSPSSCYPGVAGQYLNSSSSPSSLAQVETKYQVEEDKQNQQQQQQQEQQQQQQQQQQYLGQLAAAASGSMMCRPVH